MQTTGNLGLKKPEGTDVVDIADLNGNADILDAAVSNKVDKVAGKQLSTEDYTTAEKTKLAGVATGANAYVHPANHPASVITQDASSRFVTDAEKTAWNAKASTAVATTSAAGLQSAADKVKLDGIAAGAGSVNSATDPVIGTRTIDDTITAAAGADTPTRLWSKLANMIKGVTGSGNWYTLPSMTITAIITALGLKANSASPVLTGTPTAPTAAMGSNTTQVATTAFVQQEITNDLATVAPPMSGVATAGNSLKLARENHVHPTDTSRAPLASPAFFGTPTAPTAVIGTNTTQIATTQFVRSALGTILNAGTNLDTITNPGRYDVSGALNRPSGASDWIYLDVIVHSNTPNYCKQISYDFYSNLSWARTRYGSAWTVWSPLQTSEIVAGTGEQFYSRIDNVDRFSGNPTYFQAPYDGIYTVTSESTQMGDSGVRPYFLLTNTQAIDYNGYITYETTSPANGGNNYGYATTVVNSPKLFAGQLLKIELKNGGWQSMYRNVKITGTRSVKV
ncbi:pyocin knob domain-containing protein [Paenibacillus sp. 2TAB26]|uniref:pyocin knob domain-containing protein n=1 Tax=Paenibacillus sp. 2TAB26 TaxID=3233005 RepID=UPI003F99B2FA